MAATNGHTNEFEHVESAEIHAPLAQPPKAAVRRTTARIRQAVAELEVPFDPAVVEWRIIKFERNSSNRKGLLMPYADPRAYIDRLNLLFSPAGWTRKYMVRTSANFQRTRDGKMVAKVFVTCELKIFGLGAHAATGEEWTDDKNAVTSAEAQAFKRACCCFGLGRYLYSLGGVWVELDEHKRAKQIPVLAEWATPEGWQQGQRPGGEPSGFELQQRVEPLSSDCKDAIREGDQRRHMESIEQIRAMAEPLGKRLYRGLLKSVAMAWKPEDVRDLSLLDKLLGDMRTAQTALDRLRAIGNNGGSERLQGVLYRFALRSVDEITTLELLQSIVAAAEGEPPIIKQQL